MSLFNPISTEYTACTDLWTHINNKWDKSATTPEKRSLKEKIWTAVKSLFLVVIPSIIVCTLTLGTCCAAFFRWRTNHFICSLHKEVDSNNCKLETSYKFGKLHGKSKLFISNATLETVFKNGVLQKPIKKIFKDGSFIEGAFNKDKAEGECKLTQSNGITIEGKFKDDYPNGTLSTLTFNNGDTIMGPFDGYEANGPGFIGKYGKDIIIKGEFKNNRPNGECTMYIKKNTVIKGTFKDGKANGHCEFTSIADNTTITGEFEDGAPNGHCVLFNSNTKEEIKGEFKNFRPVPGKCTITKYS